MHSDKISWRWLAVTAAGIVILVLGGVIGWVVNQTTDLASSHMHHEAQPWHSAAGVRMTGIEREMSSAAKELHEQGKKLDKISQELATQTGILQTIERRVKNSR